jgi:hypothetical protein
VSCIGIGIFLAVITGFRLTDHWHTSVTEAEFHRRLQEIDSPLHTHVGGQAMTETIDEF